MAARRRRSEFESNPVWEFIARPFRAIGGLFSSFGGSDRIRSEETIASKFSFLLFPIKLLVAVLSFMILSWTVTRRGWPFLLGLPAFMAIAGMSLAAWLNYYLTPRKIDRTQLYFDRFLADPEWGPKIAQHFAAKKVALEPDKNEAKYQLAMVWEQLGESFQSRDLMTHLADKDFPDSHVWFARKYLSGDPSLSRDEIDAEIRRHISKAMESDPENTAARVVLAGHSLNRASQLPKDSKEYVELVNRAQEELQQVFQSGSAEAYWQLPNLIRSLVELDKQAEARTAFEQASRALTLYIKRAPQDRLVPAIWDTLIRSAVQLKDFSLANSLVEQARLQADSPIWRRELGRYASMVVLEEANTYTGVDGLEKRIGLLCAALASSPSDQFIAAKLIEEILPDSSQSLDLLPLERAKTLITHPEMIHLLLGIAKITQGDVISAQTHWKIANSQTPVQTQIALSSLVSALVSVHVDSFENVQDVISLAIEQFPEQALFYEVRGSFFKRNKQYEAAVADFQHAATAIAPPRNFPMYIHLIQCYKGLGDQEKADEQRRALQKIMNDSSPADRQFIENLLEQVDNQTAES